MTHRYDPWAVKDRTEYHKAWCEANKEKRRASLAKAYKKWAAKNDRKQYWKDRYRRSKECQTN